MKVFLTYLIPFFLITASSKLFCQNFDFKHAEIELKLQNFKALDYEGLYKLVRPILKNKKEHIRALDYLGRFFMEKEVSDSTIYYGNKIYELAVNKTDSLSYAMLSNSYNMLAVGYGFKGLTGLRGRYHLKGLELYENGLIEKEIAVHHIRGMADYYLDSKEYRKAIPLYKQSIEIDKNNHTVYFSYNNLGVIYTQIKQYKKALSYLKKACNAPKEHKAYGYCYESISACFYKMGKIDQAIYYGLLAKQELEGENEYAKFMLLINTTIGKSYYKKKKYDEAISILESTLKKSNLKGFIDIDIQVLESLSKVFVAKNNYDQAYKYVQKGYQLKDSLKQNIKNRVDAELEAKFQILQKENEIALLKKDKQLKESQLVSEKKNKQLLVIAFLIVLIPCIFLLITYNQKLITQNKLNKKQEEINIEKVNSLIKEQELKLIRESLHIQNKERERIAQELHDSIGGNLAAIKLQFDTSKNQQDIFEKPKKQIDETYQLIREIFKDLMPEKTSQNKFTDLLNEYLKNIGKTKKINITFNVFPENEINIIPEKLKIEIFLIIQELLKNTVEHACATCIDLQINKLGNDLQLLFEDNGVGFISNKIKVGVGLKNVKSRLKKINGDLKIDSVLDRGTILNIEIKDI